MRWLKRFVAVVVVCALAGCTASAAPARHHHVAAITTTKTPPTTTTTTQPPTTTTTLPTCPAAGITASTPKCVCPPGETMVFATFTTGGCVNENVPATTTTTQPPTTTTTLPATYCGTPGSIWQSLCNFVDPPGTEYSVPASAQAACTALGGVNDLGSTIYGNAPMCYDVTYIDSDGSSYDDNFPYTVSGVSTTDIYGNPPGHIASTTRQECLSGDYPDANPGVNTPGVWNSQFELCLPTSR
jgi:hypothetical protein